ncbi:uncharacterized protein SPSK_08648 [Sporothrix schenckii 1099-18]|uniref:Protein kinase domain-containing protein n=2 Tax=Sporothrix schenckii TaxID=29908 RepID=U7Q7U3_SPOS1|nr:uncharacterized protein SPSK_08648 [Sporothrix schenckii 1099-18]ERT03120.1 hypothetical protein HMPREF1624_01425 [Sporothrix schenckii ATCC 58251]KJR84472.1 hypothetical protein SPSK_08648 [Sporothrix schenckii 1099-18]
MEFSFGAIHDVVHATAAFCEETASDSDLSSHFGDYGQGYETPSSGEEDANELVIDAADWRYSQLNPRNRIDSLAPLARPLWRIDGSAGFGTQFYAYPLFLESGGPPPMHLDVFIKEQTAYPPLLRELLDMSPSYHTKDAPRVRRLGIARYILRILQWHTVHPKGALQPETVESLYKNGPFGSMILIENLCCHIHKVRVNVSLNYALEGDLMSYRALKDMWGLSDGGDDGAGAVGTGKNKDKEESWETETEIKKETKRPLPPEISILNVRLVRQMHDSISLVEVCSWPVALENTDEDEGECDRVTRGGKNKHHGKGRKGNKIINAKRASRDKDAFEGVVEGRSFEPELVILKSLTSGVKYLYQELRALLRDIPPHDGVLTRPLHVISKECLFGKKLGVIGFTMPYYEAGSLRDALPLLRIHGQLTYADQLRWACQITEAMCHVWYQGHGFYYPDLRLDNVVLTAQAPAGNAGLVDFEQRGVWCSFSAPEVDYIESIRVIAFDNDDDTVYGIPEEVSFQFQQRLISCYEAAAAAKAVDAAGRWKTSVHPPPLSKIGRHPLIRLGQDTRYSNPEYGYNVVYNCLTKSEQEASMVYMLGRLLWCIFEGMSAPHRGAVWMSYPREPELEFPAFRLTPPDVKSMILKCFGDVGAKEQSKFMRQNSKIYLKRTRGTTAATESNGEPSYELVGDGLKSKARDYWRIKLAEGDEWVKERNARLAGVKEDGNKDDDDDDTIRAHVIGEDEHAERNIDGSTVEKSAHGRPTLRQVLQWLQKLQREMDGL